MKPIRAQLARRSRPARAWWVTCALSVAVAVLLGGLAWQAEQRVTVAKLEWAQLDERARHARALNPLPATALPPPYDASAREYLAQAAVPWPALLAALEAASVEGVRLVNVDYAAAESRARVDIAFTNHAAALEYVGILSAGVPDSGPAWRWRPLQLVQPRATEKGTATLEATWSAR